MIDFGFAKVITKRTYTICGTPEYIAPEILLNQGHGKAVDWWTVGILLYEMVTGKRAFSGDSSVETLNAILKEEPGDLQEISREVSPALERIIRHCLEKRPEERFQSARDVAFDLEAHTDPSTSGAVEAIDAAPSRPRIRTLAWLAGAVLLAGVAPRVRKLQRAVPGRTAGSIGNRDE